MWFCNKCNDWYDDSVTILKHFQDHHNAAKSNNQKDTSPTPVSFPAKARMSILKTKPTSLLAKSKLEAMNLNKRFLSTRVHMNSNEKLENIPKPKNSETSSFTVQQALSSTSDSALVKKMRMMKKDDNDDSDSYSKQIELKIRKTSQSKNGVCEPSKIFICKYCCRKFPSGGLLQAHVTLHGDCPEHACHICGFTAGTFSALMTHYVKHSGIQPLDNASIISNTVEKREQLGKKKEKSDVLCNKCRRSFLSKDAFIAHYCPLLNKKTEYVCAYCRKVLSSVDEYRRHIQSHSSSQYTCQYCSTTFKKKFQLDRHSNFCPKRKAKSAKFASEIKSISCGSNSSHENKKIRLSTSPIVTKVSRIPKKEKSINNVLSKKHLKKPLLSITHDNNIIEGDSDETNSNPVSEKAKRFPSIKRKSNKLKSQVSPDTSVSCKEVELTTSKKKKTKCAASKNSPNFQLAVCGDVHSTPKKRKPRKSNSKKSETIDEDTQVSPETLEYSKLNLKNTVKKCKRYSSSPEKHQIVEEKLDSLLPKELLDEEEHSKPTTVQKRKTKNSTPRKSRIVRLKSAESRTESTETHSEDKKREPCTVSSETRMETRRRYEEEDITIPARRSARLVNKKPLNFSKLSSSGDESEREENVASSEQQTFVSQDTWKLPKRTDSMEAKEDSELKKMLIPDETEVKLEFPFPQETIIKQEIEEDNEESELVINESATLTEDTDMLTEETYIPTPQTNIKKEPLPISDFVQDVQMEEKGPKFKAKKRKLENTGDLFCNLCSLSFRCASSLRRHKKMHTGKPQFLCQFCGKFFFRRDTHQRHELSVHQHASTILTYCCYYCKQIFETSNKLHEHVVEVHASKALTPERIRRVSNIKKIRIEISELPTQDCSSAPTDQACKQQNIADAKDSEVHETINYNCGICHAIFNEPETLISHFSDVHGISDFLNAESLEQYKKKGGPSEVLVETQSSYESSKNLQVIAKNTKILQATSSKIKKPNRLKQANSSKSELELQNTAHQIINSLPDKEQWEQNYTKAKLNTCVHNEGCTCNESLIHKAVDWYQCSICTVYGTQIQVQQHMSTHMQKVGTFIVSVEDKSMNCVMPYLPHLSNNKSKEDPSSTTENCNSEDELASHQIENACNSVSSLMSEVKCRFCNDVIIDLKLLLFHQCLDVSSDPYMCFVEYCIYKNAQKKVVQNHLREAHFVPLYSDSRLLPELVAQNDETSSAVDLLHNESESIVVEPNLDYFSSQEDKLRNSLKSES